MCTDNNCLKMQLLHTCIVFNHAVGLELCDLLNKYGTLNRVLMTFTRIFFH